MERLLAEGANINSRVSPRNGFVGQSPLWVAAEQGNVETVSFLIEHGADIQLDDEIHGLTPLHIAAKNGHLEVVKLLVEKGADMTVNNSVTNWGDRRLRMATTGLFGSSVIPLDIAAKFNHKDVAAFLAERQGDFEACMFASSVAAAMKHDEIAAMLADMAQQIKLRKRAGVQQGSRPSRGSSTL